MDDAERDQRVRRQDTVHMGVQIRSELAVRADICLDDRFLNTETVILCLAHQRFGNGRNRGFQLHPAVGIDVGDFGIAKTQDIHTAVLPVHVTGNLVADHLKSFIIQACLQFTELGKVCDQIACVVVWRSDDIEHPCPIEIEFYGNILFPIQIKLLKKDHDTPPLFTRFHAVFHVFFILSFPAALVNKIIPLSCAQPCKCPLQMVYCRQRIQTRKEVYRHGHKGHGPQ